MTKWQIFVKHDIPTLFMRLIASGMSSRVFDLTGFAYLYYKKVSGYSYKDLYHDERFRVHIKKQYALNARILSMYLKAGANQCRALELQADTAALSCVGDAPAERLERNLAAFCDAYERVSPHLLLPPVIETIAGQQVERIIEETVGVTRDDAAFAPLFIALTEPERATRFSRAQDLLLEFAKRVRKSRAWARAVLAASQNDEMGRVPREIVAWASRYAVTNSWINYEHGYGSDYKAVDVIRLLADLLTSDVASRTNNLVEAVSARRRMKTQFLREHDISRSDLRHIDLMRSCIFFRNARLESYNVAGRRVRRLIEKLGTLLDMEYDTVVYLTPDEINRGLNEAGAAPKMSSLALERQRDYGLVMTDGKINILSGDDAASVREEPPVAKDVRNLTGVTGNVGVVEGNARLVFAKADFPKVRKGDIIVTPMTTPEYAPVLWRAKGIATDLGGFTSHQVQTARDLGIPCVIDLRVATRILQDGERIRLDANKGLVSRLTKCAND